MSTMIKICGLSTPETVDAAVEAGATHVGFVHFEKSPRHVSLAQATALRQRLPEHVKAVVLTVNAGIETTAHVISNVKPDIVQFHGTETPEWAALLRDKTGVAIWKAIGVRDKGSLERSMKFAGHVERILFDAPAKALPGGNGETFLWSLLDEFEHHTPWGLAGGLTPENVAEAIRATRAELVDTSSGVESAPGTKDVDLIRAFCEAARGA